MSNSLADQLLKAGVVSEEEVERSQKQKKRPHNSKQKRPHNKKAGSSKTVKTPPQGSNEVANAAARKAVEAGQKATQKDAAKKQQQQEAEKRRLINLKILDALKEVKVEDPKGDEKFNYPYQGKVRGIYVSKTQREKLAARQLAITILKAKSKLIPIDVVNSLTRIDPDRFIFIVPEENHSEEYADHQIPDDLMW